MKFKLGPHDSLVEKSTVWDFAFDTDAEQLEQAMCSFMIESNGIGLAANQIGITKRVFVMGSNNIPGFPAPFAVFNPRIIEASAEIVLDQEGCLSYPGLFLTVKRPSWIVAEYQNAKGDMIEAKYEGYLAKCFQHELDHLDGVCFVDKVSPLKLQLAMKKINKVKK
jgi:peptide deformylase